MITIKVNGKAFEVDDVDGVATLSYERVVELAGLSGQPTIVGRSRAPAWPEGSPQGFTLTVGGECWVLNGAVFTVAHTGNA